MQEHGWSDSQVKWQKIQKGTIIWSKHAVIGFEDNITNDQVTNFKICGSHQADIIETLVRQMMSLFKNWWNLKKDSLQVKAKLKYNGTLDFSAKKLAIRTSNSCGEKTEDC